VVGLLAWVARRFSSRPTQVVERKLTANSSENSVDSAAVSPEGKYLAYTDNTGLYLKVIRTGETHTVPLPTDFSAHLHIDDWFPDGSHLLISHEEESVKNRTVFPASAIACGVFQFSEAHLVSWQTTGREDQFRRTVPTLPFNAATLAERSGLCRATERIRSRLPPISLPGGKSEVVSRRQPNRLHPNGQTYNARVTSVEVNEWRKPNAQTILSDNNLGPSLYWLPNGFLVYTLGDSENQQGASLWMAFPPESGKTLASRNASREELDGSTGLLEALTGNC